MRAPEKLGPCSVSFSCGSVLKYEFFTTFFRDTSPNIFIAILMIIHIVICDHVYVSKVVIEFKYTMRIVSIGLENIIYICSE